MTLSSALDWYRQMLWAAVLVGGPVILASVITGLVVAVVQAATQVNDSAVSFAPKALVTTVTLVLAGPWMMSQLMEFTRSVFEGISSLHP
jgi:flagellar biosynthetic protein FliQ